MKTESRSQRRKQKLQYLVDYHGGLAAIATAAKLTPGALARILKGRGPSQKSSAARQPEWLETQAARQIETSLDLCEGWFDSPGAVPSRFGPD